VTVNTGAAKEKNDEDPSERIVNLLEVGGGHQVMLEVRIAEMSRNLRRNLGTNFNVLDEFGGNIFSIQNMLGGLTGISPEWTASLADGTLESFLGMTEVSQSVNLGVTGFGVSDGVYQFFFEMMERNGLAKILAEPTLVARSGESASFLVGGEIPIPVLQGGDSDAITIEYKAFGVGLDFSPTVLSSNRILLTVKPEVSEPDFSQGTTFRGTTIPGFITRRAATTIELGDGQSFAIAGLLKDNVIESVEKYPILGDIPILGVLFRSTKFQKEETELVIIVTPRIVRPVPAGSLALPTDHFVEPNAAEWYLLARMEGSRLLSPEEDEEQASAPQKTYRSMSTGGGIIGNAGHRVTAEPELQETEE
jgi:pilus assembly protein CpaC